MSARTVAKLLFSDCLRSPMAWRTIINKLWKEDSGHAV